MRAIKSPSTFPRQDQMPASYVKPYVKRGKTGQADAEARLAKR